MGDYEEFLSRKLRHKNGSGIKGDVDLHPKLFPHQDHMTRFALRIGRAAEFLDTGLGKTASQLEWCRVIVERENVPALILAPLAVSHQTAREAKWLGIDARVVASGDEVTGPGVWITNYEKLHHFDPDKLGAVVLDESGILKSFAGKTRASLVEAFGHTPFRLCCTATPSPNDHVELGNHSDFLGYSTQMEMLSRYFINDTSSASHTWRLKRHGIRPFWDWVSSWSRCVSLPSDLGHPDGDFRLPPLHIEPVIVGVDLIEGRGEFLFRMPGVSATSIHTERRKTAAPRAEAVAKIVHAEPNEPFLVWCDTNYEADELTKAIPSAVEIRGNMTNEQKEERLMAFTDGEIGCLVTKPKIAGFGLNWQHCARVVFAGMGYSYESFYQAVRRCWRFGQKRPVRVWCVMGETETHAWDVVQEKAEAHDDMKTEMLAATRRAAVEGDETRVPYVARHKGRLPTWLQAS